jgi:nucleotide-binding universal stress UspA family protein
MYKRVLVPLDGSPPASRALGEAIELARSQGAEVQLIHVVDDWKVAAGDIAAVNLEAGSRRLREAGHALLGQAEARVRQAGVPVSSLLLEEMGLPVGACIVKRAREWPADLIVCGTHGRRGVRRLLLGSDAEYIVRHTPVPVLVVRALEGSESR